MNPFLDRWSPFALLLLLILAVWLDHQTIRIPSPMPLIELVMGWIDPTPNHRKP